SEIIVKAIVEATQKGSFSLAGGGQTASVIDKFASKKDFSYMSLAGGAVLEFLAGKELPGLTSLEKSFEKFSK
ncbi:MAG: phosphoglycerate kinase, partial [Nanoarchaeota archaeon]|nr:phosphoglycerate kinase [Nanoarchaeota archaeon]